MVTYMDTMTDIRANTDAADINKNDRITGTGALEWKRSSCPYDCPDSCGLLMETDGKWVYRVKGDPDHPVTRGFICRKMQHYEQTIHHPDRILTPLKRTGKKGSGAFMAVSWEEAVREITDRWKSIIAKYGSEAIVPYSYAGNLHLVQNKCGEAFFHRLGATVMERTICSKARTAGFKQIIGDTGGIDTNDIHFSDFIIIWGSNINATQLHIQAQIMAAKKQGAKVVLVETYRTPAAALADEVILLPPGTDGALALAMGCVLKKNDLLNMRFIKKHTSGWRRFLRSLDACTLPWVEAITHIPACTVENLAKAYGKAKAPLIILGSGFSRQGNGAMTTRCICTLPALTGAFFRKGGGITGNISTTDMALADMVRRPDFLKKDVRRLNMNQIGSALCGDQVDDMGVITGSLEPPVMSLYVYNSNPVDIAPAQKKIIEGLMREDLFTVVHERFMTDTARFADIILPADTSAEHANVVTPYGHYEVCVSAPVIAPQGQCRSNWDTFCLLAQAMGFEEDYFKYSNMDFVRMIAGTDWENCHKKSADDKEAFLAGNVWLNKKAVNHKIKTASGRIEFYRPELAHPLPAYIPAYGGRYPLKLVVAPGLYTLNSTFTERKELRDKRGRSVLKINTHDAYVRGIADGNIVEADNDLASVQFFADVTDDVPEGTVVAEGVYGIEESLTELTVNALLSERLTDGGRASSLCDNTIEVRKI